MTEPITEPTPAQKPAEPEPTPAPKGGNKPDISPEVQAIIDKAVTDRLAREKASHEREKAALDKEKAAILKERDDLSKKIQEFEEKDLAEKDKLQKKLERLAGQIKEKEDLLAAKDAELSGIKLSTAKTNALLAAGALPDQIPKLLKRVAGTTEEEISADVEELKSLGWIGKVEVPLQPAATGSGHPPPKGDAKTYTREQLKDPAFYKANREDILKASAEGRLK